MILFIIRGFLMVSGGLFWILLAAGVAIDIRTRRWLRRYKTEWPEPDFDEARERRARFKSV